MEISLLVEKLLKYSQIHLDLKGLDVTYCRNLVMAALKLNRQYEGEISGKDIAEIKNMQVPDAFIDELVNYARENKLCDEGMEQNFAANIMGILSPSPENIAKKFRVLKRTKDITAACGYLYNLSIKNNYIQKTAIEKNIIWRADYDNNYLEITINLSKPEKDNKDILKQLKQTSTSYPKCMLCLENVGFEGNLVKPPRQNLRVMLVKLNNENWFMQYSPYLYYNEHCIVIANIHRPMKVDDSTVEKLMDFTEAFPQYFIGSNASLPIVGGSILSHEHFQGGGHSMPLFNAKDRSVYKSNKFNKVKISTLEWYNSAIRLVSNDKNQIKEAGKAIFSAWKNYNDESVEIISKTSEQHNAFTPIMRKKDGQYVFEIILRNNRTDERYPDGIFHAHQEFHNIKKEGIGLIEAMGLFILPGRLKKQTEEIKNILCGKRDFGSDIEIHKNMVESLIKNYGNNLNYEKADKAVTGYINDVCKNILINTATFKPDEKGKNAFDKFMKSINW